MARTSTERGRAWYAANREKARAKSRAHYLANRDKYLARDRARKLAKRLGVTVAELPPPDAPLTFPSWLTGARS
jgi:hypothetical protein